MSIIDTHTAANPLINKLRDRFDGTRGETPLTRAEAEELFAAYVKLDRRITRIGRISDNYQAEIKALVHELQDALDELRDLKGYIPVCTSCRKIRNDRGYWKQLEQYLCEQTREHFTNDLCPDCGGDKSKAGGNLQRPRTAGTDKEELVVEHSELADPVIARFLPLFNDPQLTEKPLFGELSDLFRRYVRQNRRLKRISRISDNYQFELKEANAALRSQNSELEEFSYSVSHDLKSPLITIVAFADLLLTRDAVLQDVDALSFLEHIQSAANKMRQLLDGLRELGRIGRMVNPTQSVDLAVIVAEALSALQGPLEERQTICQIAVDLPKVIGDPVWLRQVMQNLLENAIKYVGEQPEPRIEVGVADSARGSAVFVRDNGQGIPLEYQERVFEAFERLARDSEGTGLGLALVKRIIGLHHGQVWIESAGLGQGTTVWLTLPAE